MKTLTQAKISAVAGGIGVPASDGEALASIIARPQQPQARPEGTMGSGGDIRD